MPPEPRARSRRRWLERLVGIALGLILGLAIVIGFVFYGSEETIDAPRISDDAAGGPRLDTPGGLPFDRAATLPLVRIVDGAPPASGPPRLDFRQGREARFVVDSNQAVGIEVRGYGVSRTIEAGRSTIGFQARKRGQYAVVVVPSQIQVASMRVRR